MLYPRVLYRICFLCFSETVWSNVLQRVAVVCHSARLVLIGVGSQKCCSIQIAVLSNYCPEG